MKAMLVRIQTYTALGKANIFRVGLYRIGLKTGLHPCMRISAQAAKGPFYRACEKNPEKGAVARQDWVGGFGLCFGRRVPLANGENPPDWHRPLEGGLASNSDSNWWELPDFDAEVGDIKRIWEASRFDWLLAIAQRAAMGDSDELNRLNLWLSDWSENNSPYRGANWKCGQEASFRVLHLIAGAYLLGQHEAPESGLKSLVRLHLARIAPTMGYAIGQANNHGTSEAAALFVGGSFLADADGEEWADKGRFWLENRARVLIEADGTFSQYSAVYHRLMLDTYSFAETWRKARCLRPFSENLYQRLSAATSWIEQLVDPVSGDVPNLGANDGAQILSLSQTDFRDFRPSLQLASALFRKTKFDDQTSSNQPLLWLGLRQEKTRPQKPTSRSFDDGGIHVLRCGKAAAYLRYPRYRFRPGQADALHCDLWIKHRNVLRDAGTFSYNSDELAYFHGTSSHNTVEFDERDQMPKLGRFLFGSWLKAVSVRLVSGVDNAVSAAAGYRDYCGSCHEREIFLDETSLRVVDIVSGFERCAVLRWRLAPGAYELTGSQVVGAQVSLNISASVPIARIEMKQGLESQYYLQKTELPVLEVELGQPGTIETEIKF